MEFVRVRIPGARRLEHYAKVSPTAAGRELTLLAHAPWTGIVETGVHVPFDEQALLAPVEPSKIVCVGRNYRAHVREMNNELPTEPLLFFKPPSAIIAPGEAIELPSVSQRVDHEAELGVVIGRRCRRVSSADALDYLFGYTCVNDVTARDLQKKDGQWARAKGFDTFCPVGPSIVTSLELRSTKVTCWVNSEQRQQGSVSDMIFPVAELISYISHIMTLEPGDLIATGTPEGVSPLTHSDVVEVNIEGIGTLKNRVIAKSSHAGA